MAGQVMRAVVAPLSAGSTSPDRWARGSPAVNSSRHRTWPFAPASWTRSLRAHSAIISPASARSAPRKRSGSRPAACSKRSMKRPLTSCRAAGRGKDRWMGPQRRLRACWPAKACERQVKSGLYAAILGE